MEEHISQGQIIYMSICIAAYIWAAYYLFFVFIPRRVTKEKLKVSGYLESMSKIISEMEAEKIRVEKILTARSGKINMRGFKVEYLPPGIEKSNKIYSKFLNKPADYYAGKNLITLLRIIYLEINFVDLESERDNIRTLINDVQKFVDQS